jgi:hypothetical protein
MSYARFAAESDVYVFLAVGGHLECCGCALGGEECFYSTAEMLAHLDAHRVVGHDVPDYCTDRLRENQKQNDAFIRRNLVAESASDETEPSA